MLALLLIPALIAVKICSVLRETYGTLHQPGNLGKEDGFKHNRGQWWRSQLYGNGDTLRHAMRIIIESGAIYSASVVALFVAYVAQSNSTYAISDAVSQFIRVFGY